MEAKQRAAQYDPTNLASVAHRFGRWGDDAPVLELLAQGVDPNTTHGYGNVPALYWAATFDRPEVLQALLEAGANPNLTGMRQCRIALPPCACCWNAALIPMHPPVLAEPH